ncbi:uncharacterized protein LOC131952507 isoform X2 [Physella acuta]|nr:uncharacterized protein LOC131952507 isoform X2 [Physella acuta]
MDQGGDKNISLSADEDDYEPELSDQGHKRRESGHNWEERSTNQAGHTESYGQDYYDYEYDESTAADQLTDQRDHYTMKGIGDNDKYYDDDDCEPLESSVDNPHHYSDDTPARNEQQAYSHNKRSAYPKRAYDAHKYTCATPTSPSIVPSDPRTNNVEQNKPQPTPYVQNYRDNTSVVNTPNSRDAPAPQMGAIGPRMTEEPFQDVPSYKCISILVMLFCCLPLGIAGLVYTFSADNLKIRRKYSEAKKVAKKAETLNVMGVFSGILIWTYNVYSFFARLQSQQNN